MTDSYRSEDVQQILQRAMARQQEGEFSQQQLLEMASELNISADTLQFAEQEWLARRQETQERQAFNAQQRKGFRAHLIPYLAVNTSLVLLNLVTSPTHFWAVYPLTGWGLGLALHGRCAYQIKGDRKGHSKCGVNIARITT